jgi:N-acetylmuramoyl-L-alanine amidase
MVMTLFGLGLAVSFLFQTPQDFPMPVPWAEPGFAKLIWVQSPNYNRRPDDAVIDTIVLHSTVIPTLEATTRAFYDTKSQVSSHFTIGKDGSIVQNVSTFKRAWHAGVSKDIKGRENLNNFSIGIELVNLNDGKDPYPPAQIEVLRYLILTLKRRFPTLHYITSHEYIAVPHGRKSDPLGFPWSTLEGMGFELVH